MHLTARYYRVPCGAHDRRPRGAAQISRGRIAEALSFRRTHPDRL
ncbi:MAG TPA: hypothetical protein VFY19_08180 [Geminicoccaceae bacterium]|nr:hypothetical protein [Geminicoccaceae bacterium]